MSEGTILLITIISVVLMIIPIKSSATLSKAEEKEFLGK